MKVPQMVEAQSGYVRVEVDCALICDYATVREGLLHILGGGVSRLMGPVSPAPFAAGLALRILLHPTELDAEHTVKIQLVDSDRATVAELTSTFSVPQEQRASLEPGGELAVNMPLNLPMVAIPKQGALLSKFSSTATTSDRCPSRLRSPRFQGCRSGIAAHLLSKAQPRRKLALQPDPATSSRAARPSWH